ncbi:Hypothetical protein, putative [Bodo saltans]|uniref:Uncharacterized protein n=1 Tax=Bodo saltans TaxID=75058 RepID=A0A0S4IK62_BODSA|nr:Hypothetical protein, putative [Bodo saltans]|eukprot:CUE61569.1 Hypothetical protein, putative [Bodo saltans]
MVGAMFLAASYWYVNIRGTKLELPQVPHEEVCATCGGKRADTTKGRLTMQYATNEVGQHHHHHHDQQQGNGYFTHSCANNTSFSLAAAATTTNVSTTGDAAAAARQEGGECSIYSGTTQREVFQGEPLAMIPNLPNSNGHAHQH